MNIIIPLGGKGERFSQEGYTLPKAMIPIHGKPMIANVIDHLSIGPEDNLILIYNKTLDNFQFRDEILSRYPDAFLIRLDKQTQGAAETVYLGISNIFQNWPVHRIHSKTLLLDCDTIYTENIIQTFRNSEYSMVFYTEKSNEPPIYSYIQMDASHRILDIAEKQKISNFANTGAYGFTEVRDLMTYCKYVVDNNIVYNGEPYTSCAIKEMLVVGHRFIGSQCDSASVFSVGTPLELRAYIDRSYAFLFDLDGTLVITDDIYFEVWRQILKSYEIDLSRDMFTRYIQGNNDHYIVSALLSNVSVDLHVLSETKDALFLKHVDKIRLVSGVLEFFKTICECGHNIAIVTNCNRRVAEAIVRQIGVDSYIEFILSADDCAKRKPFPDPYVMAMKKFDVPNNRSFIFEDSKTGILSGKSARPKCLIGIETTYSRNELLRSGVDMTVLNYKEMDINNLIQYSDIASKKLEDYIRQSLDMDCVTIEIDSDKLKGGYIADVLRVRLTKDNGDIINCVLKLENPNETSLAQMATRLQLYQREYYFYETIAKYVKSIRIPKCIGLIKNQDMQSIGVLLENLYATGNYVPNLNLNTSDINVSLKIIDRMAKFHAKFWNCPLQSGFPQLKTSMDSTFRPFCYEHICEFWDAFVLKWERLLTRRQLEIGLQVKTHFLDIQERLSLKNTTLVHGDIKSPNIFYDLDRDCEPVFLDWQHCMIGKGTQDLAFFIIESFDLEKLDIIYPLFKNYYYCKLIEYGIVNYSYDDYEQDLHDAICYTPFFTAVWFGTVNYDDLIDKNFPFFFLQKLFALFDKTMKN
jgi:beta-phosphoglucomutase-like phosphatase (HAD superfamily)/dTDP-glucose pyrophosphorylase